MKKIFYYTDALPFLAQEESAINKLIHSLEVFRSSSPEIRLVWHPWSGTEECLRINNSKALERYQEIVDEYRAAAWGDLDVSNTFAEAKELMLGCDGYYGDISNLAYEAENAGMPVMIQNLTVV
jgi:hypothetical protein